MSSSQPEFEKYSEALSRAVRDFKERLEGKTKELQLATGFSIHEGGEMRNAFQTLYEIEEKRIQIKAAVKDDKQEGEGIWIGSRNIWILLFGVFSRKV